MTEYLTAEQVLDELDDLCTPPNTGNPKIAEAMRAYHRKYATIPQNARGWVRVEKVTMYRRVKKKSSTSFLTITRQIVEGIFDDE